MKKIIEFFKTEKGTKLILFLSTFVIVLIVYLWTIAPTLAFWDCGEFITCSYILGIPHPPGTPLYVIIGRLFSLLPISKDIGYRVNFFSAFSSALSAAFLYLVIVKIISIIANKKENNFIHHFIALSGALLSAFAFSVWDNSVEAEVYSPSNLFLVVGIWLILHWYDNRGTKGNKNTLLLVIYLVFLSMGIHLLPLLLLPPLLIFIILVDWREITDIKFIISGILLAVIGVTTYAYLYIRAQLNPYINEADPSTLKALWAVFTREQYGPMKLIPRKTQTETGMSLIPAFWEQIKVYLKYYSWQYFPFPRQQTNTILSIFSMVGTYIYTFLGVSGMYVHYKKDKKTFWLFFTLFLLLSLGLVTYLNLRFSPSDPNPRHEPREVRERDYFFASSYFFFAFYVAIFLYYLYEKISLSKSYKYLIYPYYALIFFIPVLPIISNIKSHVNRRGDYIPYDYAYNMLVSADENSVVLTNGDNDTFPLWFMQYVVGFRKHDLQNKKGVILANLSLLNTNWYIKQLKKWGVPIDFDTPFRGIGRFEEAYKKARYRGYKGTFEDFVIDNLTPIKAQDGSLLFVKDLAIRNIILVSSGIKPTINDLFIPESAFVKKYIKPDIYKPSINLYFSATVSYESRVAYQKHLKLEGFLYKLIPEESEEEMVDQEKTYDLLMNRFKYRSIFDKRIYKDDNTKRLLTNYSALLFTLGRSLRLKVIEAPFVFNPQTYEFLKVNENQKEILKKAAEVFIKGLSFSDDERIWATIMIELRAILKVINDPKFAIEIISRLERENVSPYFLILKGEIYQNMGDLDKAELNFKKATESSKNDPGIYYSYLKILSIKGDTEKFNSILGEIFKNQELFGGVYGYANALGDTGIMIDILKYYLMLNPGDYETRNYFDSLNYKFYRMPR